MRKHASFELNTYFKSEKKALKEVFNFLFLFKHYASGARQIWELGVARIFCHNRERFGALEVSIQHILLGGSGPRIRKWWSDHPPLKDAIQFGHLGPGSHNPDP